MIVVGIESSCDETGVALVKNNKTLLANIVASSLKYHSRHGGVVPEIASRMQLESIAGVFSRALKVSRLKPWQIDLVAVTSHPGLPGSLIVGAAFAKALALSLNKPLIGIDHIHSHIFSNRLAYPGLKLPAVALVVSGGHTTLFYLKDFTDIRVLGQTRDDACGEAFDKVAKIMGLGYPGGPQVEKTAVHGNPRKIKFACLNTEKNLDFSFSGIKTAVLYYLKNRQPSGQDRRDLAASFQESVLNVLVNKALAACKKMHTSRLLIGGGVAANRCLRQKLKSCAHKAGIACFFPEMGLCMDNAAMVAGLGGYLYQRGVRGGLE